MLAYRTTPHTDTGIPPADLMFQRKIKTTIPNWSNKTKSDINITSDKNTTNAQLRSKIYRDKNRNIKENNFKIGDQVIVRQPYKNKLYSSFNPRPYIITNKKHSMITATSRDTTHSTTRNSSHFKPLPTTAPLPRFSMKEEEIDDFKLPPSNTNNEPVPPPTHPQIQQRKQYPKRYRRPVEQWRKY